jgi:hypothetical protein
VKHQIPPTELAGRVLRMSTPGVTLGALAVAPSLLGAGTDFAATFTGLLGWAVPVVVALALLVLAINDVSDGNGPIYGHGARSYATFVAVNVTATGIACAAYWVVASGASAILSRPANEGVIRAAASGLGLTSMLIIAAMSVVAAVVITAWADSRAGE